MLGFSIVLCTYNGGSRLKETMAHIASLKIPVHYSCELVLVNNASSDDTVDVAKREWKACGEPFLLRILSEANPGKGFAIECGYDASTFKYILTVDDDNWLNDDYLINAAFLFESDPDIGILQGKIEGEFETSPPSWFDSYKKYYVIGSPLPKTGYFPANNLWVWGAGMVIRAKDWQYLRDIGFTFLTSKVSGKAAGEDNETAIALLMMGRRIFYSDTLKLGHYMPASRISWEKLEKNFDVFGYVSYYYFLYAIVLDSYKKNYTVTRWLIFKLFFIHWYKRLRWFRIKSHIKYFFRSDRDQYRLDLTQYYALGIYFLKLNKNALKDLNTIERWMRPLLQADSNFFDFPL